MTNAPFRYLCRLLNRDAVLYTEMIVDRSLALTNASSRYLVRSVGDSPVVAQLGGCQFQYIQKAAEMCQQAEFDEININMGCPSSSVQHGAFGAVLMLDPKFPDVIRLLKKTVDIPVSIKCRIGVDAHDSPEFLSSFVANMCDAGIDTFIIHARKALLGRNPKENRTIPPLDYDAVYRIKKEFPHIRIILNGGLKTLQSVRTYSDDFHGIMIGRAIRDNPFFLRLCSQRHSECELQERKKLCLAYADYAEKEFIKGLYSVRTLLNPLMNMFASTHLSSLWRCHLLNNHGCQTPKSLVESSITAIETAMLSNERQFIIQNKDTSRHLA